MVVDQLAEQLLLTPENRGLIPVICNICIEHLFTFNCIEKTKIEKKEAGHCPFLCKKVKVDAIINFKMFRTKFSGI